MNENIKFAIEELDLLMNKVSRVHGKEHGELIEINQLYLDLKKEIINKNFLIARKLLNEIKTLSNDFKLPSDACTAYERVYKAFKILDAEIQ